VWHQFVVRHPQRDRLRAGLAAAGIGTGIHYPVPLHQQPAYRQAVVLPVTERAAREVFSLPMFPELRDEEVAAVCQALKVQLGLCL
jgi:dTDP-4-amino-4,6-dideoxygalactose transaminase